MLGMPSGLLPQFDPIRVHTEYERITSPHGIRLGLRLQAG